MKKILSHSRNETVPDQWEVQILVRILLKSTVIYVSEMDDEIIENMHMIPSRSIGEAIEKAKKILGMEKPGIVAIPDGVSVIVK